MRLLSHSLAKEWRLGRTVEALEVAWVVRILVVEDLAAADSPDALSALVVLDCILAAVAAVDVVALDQR